MHQALCEVPGDGIVHQQHGPGRLLEFPSCRCRQHPKQFVLAQQVFHSDIHLQHEQNLLVNDDVWLHKMLPCTEKCPPEILEFITFASQFGVSCLANEHAQLAQTAEPAARRCSGLLVEPLDFGPYCLQIVDRASTQDNVS